MIRLNSFLLVVTMALLLGCSTAFADSPNRLNGWFVFGTNFAWFDHDYGHDLGHSHPGNWNPIFTAEKCRAYFADIAAMKCRVLRVWAFEAQEGMIFDSNDLMVTGLDPLFLKNCDTMMEIAAENGLHIYWSMLNHLIVKDEEGKHMNIITDPKVRESYIQNALLPFVKRYAKHPAFFAVDIINEAEGAIGGTDAFSGRGEFFCGTSWNHMRNFIRECAKALHDSIKGVMVSSTSGWKEHKNLKRYKDLGLDFLDYHSYLDNANIPSVKDLDAGGLPVILGECGPGDKKRNDSLQAKNWKAYLETTYAKGYAGVLTWSYGTPGEDTNFSMVNKDRSWRPAASVLANFGRKTPDAGPIFADDKNNTILNSVQLVMKPVFAVGFSGNKTGSWDKFLTSLSRGKPYKNPDYALLKLDEMNQTLFLFCQNLFRYKARGLSSVDQGIKSYKTIAKQCLNAIQRLPEPMRKEIRSRPSVKSYLQGILDMSAGSFLPAVKINTGGAKPLNSSTPFGD